MAEKVTAGRDILGEFAPKFQNVMMIFYLVKSGHVKNNYQQRPVP